MKKKYHTDEEKTSLTSENEEKTLSTCTKIMTMYMKKNDLYVQIVYVCHAGSLILYKTEHQHLAGCGRILAFRIEPHQSTYRLARFPASLSWVMFQLIHVVAVCLFNASYSGYFGKRKVLPSRIYPPLGGFTWCFFPTRHPHRQQVPFAFLFILPLSRFLGFLF